MTPIEFTSRDEREATQDLIDTVLINARCARTHRVSLTPTDVTIVASTQTPPTVVQSTSLLRRLDSYADTTEPAIRYTLDFMRVVTSKGLVKTPSIHITHIDSAFLEDALRKEKEEAAKNSERDPRLVAALPETIRTRLHRFNPEMQKYIMACAAKMLEGKSKLFLPKQISRIKNMFRHSPTEASTLSIFVRSPKSNTVHDLIAILAAGERDPISKVSLNLSELIPAPEGLRNTHTEGTAARQHKDIHDTADISATTSPRMSPLSG